MTTATSTGPAVVRSTMGTSIRVEPLTCTIGAEISNVNLGDASRDEALFVNSFTTHFTNYHSPENMRFGQEDTK